MSEEKDKKGKGWVSETKSGFIDVVVKSFDNFVCTFKTHGVMVVSFILILFMLLYSFVFHPLNINEIVTDALKREKKIELQNQAKSIEQRFEADKLMNQVMEEVIDRFDVNRILCLEVHNGSSSISGLEFLFYSAVNEMISTNNTNGEEVYDIQYEADAFQKQHISTLIGNTTYKQLKTVKYLYFNDLDKYKRANYRLIYKMRQIGAESLMIIPFVADNIPQVLLIISSKEATMPAEDIYKYIERYRGIIEKTLMNV